MRIVLCCGFWALTSSAAFAEFSDQSVVHLHCVTSDGQDARGSGVVVSEEGHVLTAKHTAKPDWICSGRIGRGTTGEPKPLRFEMTSEFDAVLWRFEPGSHERYQAATYVPVDDTLRGRAITALGFPEKSGGQISERRGVISTTDPNPETGMIETDILTTRGMSGGPVLLHDTLVAIVTRANFDALGIATDYAVLPLNALGDPFGLIEAELEMTGFFPPVPSASPTAVSVMNWQDAGERLYQERGAAVSCAKAVKRIISEDSAEYINAEAAYEAARTDMNAILARLEAALINDEEDTVFADLPPRLDRVAEARAAFCSKADALVLANSEKGERLAGDLIKVVGSVVDAAVKVWIEYRSGDEIRRSNLRTLLGDAVWPAFSDIS